MKVLLTGGSGTVGHHALAQLLHAKHTVTVLELKTKHNQKILKPYYNDITVVWGSITDKKIVDSVVEEMDVIIHLGGLIPPYADTNKAETKKVNYQGTKNIVSSILRRNPNCFLLFASSISVYGDRLENYSIKVGDELRINKNDYYAFIKEKTEKMIMASGIDYSIFRLTAIMDIPALNPLMFHMPLDTKLEIASAKDTARAFVKAVKYKDVLNKKTYNLGGGPRCRTTYSDFLENCFKIYGLNYNLLKKHYFASGNFHCGYYEDGDILNNILHFRIDTLTTYYKYLSESVNPYKRMITKILSPMILFNLNRQSDFKKRLKW